ISRPLRSVNATAANIHTASREAMTAVFCSIAVASAIVTGRWMPKSGGAATIAVTSEAATTVSGRNSRSVLRIDPPRRAPQEENEQRVDDQERRTKRDLRANGRFAQ